jgi:S1-C subfamily serine protease
MSMQKAKSIALAALLAFNLTSPCFSDDLADKGREIFNKNQRSVVTVQIVLKTKFSFSGMGGDDNESKQDATGTVIDPSGLTVMSLSDTDPTAMFQALMSGMDDEDNQMKVDSELSDLKILLEDGTELSAEVVLRDKDLDLAFIRPKSKPTNAMPAIDLTKSSTGQVLDQIVSLTRLGKAAGRAYSVSVGRISAVVQKPRLFYIPDGSSFSGMGSPVFTLDGNLLGITVMRTVGGASGGAGLFDYSHDGITEIILPASDILKGVKQVPTAKATSDKKEESKAAADK